MVTPAGGQINSDWPDMGQALEGLTLFLDGASAAAKSCGTRMEDWHALFRCGTVIRVLGADPEFRDYATSDYRFPPTEGADVQAGVVNAIMADNVKVWECQKAIPGDAGKTVRQAYAKMLGQGYPYPGGPAADRTATPTGIKSGMPGAGDASPLWFVSWPNLDPRRYVYNLSIASTAAAAAMLGGTLRRYDYMFPEIAAVISPELAIWSYGPDNVFRAH